MYKFNAVHMFILPNKLIDVSILHPRGNHREPLITDRNSDQWQDIWMSEVFPGDTLSAESL